MRVVEQPAHAVQSVAVSCRLYLTSRCNYYASGVCLAESTSLPDLIFPCFVSTTKTMPNGSTVNHAASKLTF